MKQMIFLSTFSVFFFLVKTIPVAKNINICVWENKAKSWVELPIKNLGGISFWMLSWHSYAIAFNTFHPVFASVISIIAASTVHYYFSIRFVFFLVPLSHDDFFHYSVRFYNNDNNNKNEFLLLVPFTKVTFIKYTFRSFSRTMLDSLLFALGFITCIKSIIKKNRWSDFRRNFWHFSSSSPAIYYVSGYWCCFSSYTMKIFWQSYGITYEWTKLKAGFFCHASIVCVWAVCNCLIRFKKFHFWHICETFALTRHIIHQRHHFETLPS